METICFLSSTSAALSIETVKNIYQLPMTELLYRAQKMHRKNFDPNKIQTSMLLSIKTGGCPENCSYCPQSAHYKTRVEKEKLMDLDEVISAARSAKSNGATRFCMGAAWREVRDGSVFDRVLEMVFCRSSVGYGGLLHIGYAHKSAGKKN